MDIVSANMEERKSNHSDEFINFWVPVIRRLRETKQWAGINMYPSMNECVEIVASALHNWESQATVTQQPQVKTAEGSGS